MSSYPSVKELVEGRLKLGTGRQRSIGIVTVSCCHCELDIDFYSANSQTNYQSITGLAPPPTCDLVRKGGWCVCAADVSRYLQEPIVFGFCLYRYQNGQLHSSTYRSPADTWVIKTVFHGICGKHAAQEWEYKFNKHLNNQANNIQRIWRSFHCRQWYSSYWCAIRGEARWPDYILEGASTKISAW